ncbi:MAG TPA: acetyl-CoA carboxylase biotin carboxyl carrier protein subunit [Candidatus Kapabacteria bacterium]|jgi:biotin carboxyl carrier protein|nr:acetyl-CoA carboxylase biotin carboxyl carrier protein subunit [Candidatus Kapabacteria bacterium]
MKIKYDKEIYNVENYKEKEDLFVKINGNQLNYKFKKIDENHYQALNSNRKIDIFIAEDKLHKYVGFEGKSYKFEKISNENTYNEVDEKELNEEIIKSPMPGNIVKIIVKEGDTVDDGDPIIIVEAMKMETTLYSSITGIVKKIYIQENSQVDSDTALVLIEKE